MTARRELSYGQVAVLIATAVPMVAVGAAGAAGTYANVVSEFDRQATAAGAVAAGEGATAVLGMLVLGLTLLGQPSPWPVRAGLWAAPAAGACVGLAVADTPAEAVIYALTPAGMVAGAEGLALLARRIVIYRTGVDAESQRRNAAVVQQLAVHRARAANHPEEKVRARSEKAAWRLARRVGVGDPELGARLVDVQRDRLRQGADDALTAMLTTPDDTPHELPAAVEPAQPQPVRHSAREVLTRRFAEMDPDDVIRVAAGAHPDAHAGELAALLVAHGVVVDPLAVDLVLNEDRAQQPVAPVAPQVTDPAPVTIQDAIIDTATALGQGATARDIATEIENRHRLIISEAHVRTALSRASKRNQTATGDSDRNTPMNGGYV